MTKPPQIKKAKQFLEQLNGYRMVYPQVSALLRSVHGVFGTWIGTKITKGVFTGELCVAAFVQDKKPIESLPKKGIIPREITLQSDVGRVKVVTDVLEARIPRFLGRLDAELPALGGDSVSLDDPALHSGTVGFAAKRNSDNVPGFVSACHVFLKPSPGGFEPGPDLIKGGDKVVKPAACNCADESVDLGIRVRPRRPTEINDGSTYNTDIAFVEVDNPEQIDPTIRGLEWDHKTVGSPADFFDRDPPQKVRYSGATSGVVEGELASLDGDFPIVFFTPTGIPMTHINAQGLFGFTLDSRAGDSGSLILATENCDPTGISLVMAKTEVRLEDQVMNVTLGFSLEEMLKDFGCRTWNGDVIINGPGWLGAMGVMGMGADDPVNVSLESARRRIRESDIGPAIIGWYEELKTEDLASILLTDEQFSAQAEDLVTIGRRMIEGNGRLTARDLEHIGKVLERLEEKGAPAPKNLMPEVMSRLKGARGKSWSEVVDALCGKKPQKK